MNYNLVTLLAIISMTVILAAAGLYYIQRIVNQAEDNEQLLMSIKNSNNIRGNLTVIGLESLLKTQISNEKNIIGNLTSHRIISNITRDTIENMTLNNTKYILHNTELLKELINANKTR